MARVTLPASSRTFFDGIPETAFPTGIPTSFRLWGLKLQAPPKNLPPPHPVYFSALSRGLRQTFVSFWLPGFVFPPAKVLFPTRVTGWPALCLLHLRPKWPRGIDVMRPPHPCCSRAVSRGGEVRSLPLTTLSASPPSPTPPPPKGEKLYEKAVRHNLAACWDSGPTPRPGGAAGSTGASGYWLASVGCLGATPDFAG